MEWELGQEPALELAHEEDPALVLGREQPLELAPESWLLGRELGWVLELKLA
jgi:hypothetical protein